MAAVKQAQRLFVAKSSFSVEHNGVQMMASPRDEPRSEDDPLYKAVPHMFRAWEPVEQATAAPGEKRTR